MRRIDLLFGTAEGYQKTDIPTIWPLVASGESGCKLQAVADRSAAYWHWEWVSEGGLVSGSI